MTAYIAIPGETIPLWFTPENRDPGLFPLARVLDEGSVVVATLPMTHQVNGIYAASWVVTAAQKYLIDYQAFTDAPHTIPSPLIGAAQDVVVADFAAASPSAMADAVWDSLTASHVAPGTFGRLLQILTSLGGKRYFRLDQISYNADGFATTARYRAFPDSATAAASTSGGSGEGEIETVYLSGTPSLTFPQLPTTFLGV